MKHQKVTIIGVGLMGGSLGLALARRGWRVAGVGRRPARLRKARSLGAVHEITTDFKAGARGADVVVLATPVKDIVPWALRLRPYLPPDALVMDVGSVKGEIVRALDKIFSGGPFFIGTHPMAGSEKTGVEHARADLFRGAACVVTPGKRAPSSALRRAESFWRGVGGRVVRMGADEHDRLVALVSHQPHHLADSLVLCAGEGGDARRARDLAAGSFRDMTRVASADPGQWHQIFTMNDRPLRDAAAAFQKTLGGLVRRRWPLPALRRARRLHETFMRREA
jgi:prephenate dehydrogenase